MSNSLICNCPGFNRVFNNITEITQNMGESPLCEAVTILFHVRAVHAKTLIAVQVGPTDYAGHAPLIFLITNNGGIESRVPWRRPERQFKRLLMRRLFRNACRDYEQGILHRVEGKIGTLWIFGHK